MHTFVHSAKKKKKNFLQGWQERGKYGIMKKNGRVVCPQIPKLEESNMKLFTEMKNYPLEVKIFHLIFLLSIIAYVVAFQMLDWKTSGYVAYTSAFIGLIAATTGFMKPKTGAWKPAILDCILFVVLIVVHLAMYPA